MRCPALSQPPASCLLRACARWSDSCDVRPRLQCESLKPQRSPHRLGRFAAAALPEEMSGADFLAKYRTHDDAVTTVDPAMCASGPAAAAGPEEWRGAGAAGTRCGSELPALFVAGRML